MFSLSLGMPIIYTCMSQESWATVDYGIRDLVQESGLHSVGGGAGPGGSGSSTESEATHYQTPRGDMVKGQDMQGCGAVPLFLCCQALGGGPQAPIGQRGQGTDPPGTEWRRVRIHWNPLASASLSPRLTPLIFIQRMKCCFTSASKSHVNPSFASFTENHTGKAILENAVCAYPSWPIANLHGI